MTTVLLISGVVLLVLLYFNCRSSKNKNRPMRVLGRVDIQNGFMPEDSSIPGTGELSVPGAPSIIPTVNKLTLFNKLTGNWLFDKLSQYWVFDKLFRLVIELFQWWFFDVVVDSQDYHPADHGAFNTMHEGKKAFEVIDLFGVRQTLWPPHCRQGTPGCEFYPTLDRSRTAKVFRKGMDKTIDSNSAFWDNGHRNNTGQADYLRALARERGFNGIAYYTTGVTRPICVTLTAEDAVDEGFKTYLVEDACSLLEVQPGDGERDLDRLRRKGVIIIKSQDIFGKAV